MMPILVFPIVIPLHQIASLPDVVRAQAIEGRLQLLLVIVVDTQGFCSLDGVLKELADDGEIGGSAIVKGGPNTENAKIFIDWLLTKEAQELSVATSYRYPVRDDVAAPKGLPALSEVDLVNYDRAKASSMKEAVLEKFEAEITSNR